MSLKDKAAAINFDDLDEETTVASNAPISAPAGESAPPARSRTGVAGITERINLHHQVQDLQSQVAQLEKAQIVVQLDPKRIRPSKWKNRHELSYRTQDFAELKTEIEAAGGNVQPIKVRRVGKGADGEDEYEIVYGRRRLRACDELGFQVAAIIEEMDDITLFKEMERENRSRADLTPWEQGVMYKDALEAKLFASQRQMAGELNISLGALNVALSLASLPEEIIRAFPSPLELQYRWAAELNAALEKDTARVMTAARELAALTVKPSAKQVLSRLTASGDARGTEATERQLKVAGRVVGTFAKDSKGSIRLTLKAGALSTASEKKLVDFVDKLLS